MAGISTIWCAWIEQGREVQASPRALSRLAKALALSAEDRAMMFELAGRADPCESGPSGEGQEQAPKGAPAPSGRRGRSSDSQAG